MDHSRGTVAVLQMVEGPGGGGGGGAILGEPTVPRQF